MTKNLLIVGAGSGLSAALAKRFASEGYRVTLAARSLDKLSDLCQTLDASAIACDAANPQAVEALFQQLDAENNVPDVVIYNAGAYTRGPVAELDVARVQETLMVNAYGALLVAREAAKRMQERKQGTLLFTGASAGIKGYAQSAPFAMGKFALRGLCQSLARELAPQNIHIAHIIIDGVIFQPSRGAPYDNPDVSLHPDHIAESYWALAQQKPSAWTYEIELRPYVETF